MLNRIRELRARVRRMVDRAIDTWYYGVPARAVDPHSTHLPVLIALARIQRVERVLELGAGIYSTPAFLDRAVFPDVEGVLSLETSAEWAGRVQGLVGTDARLKLRLVDEPMSNAIEAIDVHACDLIFVDDSMTAHARAATIRALARRRPLAIVAIHDFENPAYRSAARGFLYRYRFSAINPNVGIVSNSKLDTAKLAKIERAIARARARYAFTDRHAWREVVNASL